jgi:hypothetical protein
MIAYPVHSRVLWGRWHHLMQSVLRSVAACLGLGVSDLLVHRHNVA